MTPTAYGALQLKPWEFGRLTVGEFNDLVKGYEWRTEQRRIANVRLAVPIINSCAMNLKRPVTLETLLGYDPVKKAREELNKQKSGDQLRGELASLMDEIGGEEVK